MNNFEKLLQRRFDSSDAWSIIRTKGGGTQRSEIAYKTVVKDVVYEMGGEVVLEAGSQQKHDLHVVWSDGRQCTYELKKKDTKGGQFMLNDTIPEVGISYVFINTDARTIRVCDDLAVMLNSGIAKNVEDAPRISHIRQLLDSVEAGATAENVLELGTAVMDLMSKQVQAGILSLASFGQFFKRRYDFENCFFRPRPNFCVAYESIFPKAAGSCMSLKELKRLASDLKIKNRAKMCKNDLLNALSIQQRFTHPSN